MTARPEMDERLLDEALGWQHALEAEDADWDGYVLWLEADPRHREAFDAIALTDRIVADHRADLHLLTAAAALPDPVRASGRRTWLAGSVAAALALAIGIPAFRPMSAGDTVYTTATGQTRRIALAGGTAIDLAPGSRLVAKDGDANRLELTGGEAFFAVDHDPGRTLSIKAGDYAIRDIGTKFTINLAPETVLVSVAEGNLAVGRGDAAPDRVSAGQRYAANRSGGDAQVTPIAAAAVGSWRQGRLAYENIPLSIVAADISRYVGKTIVVDPAIGARRFSGVLVIGDGTKLLANLSEFMAVSYRMEGDRVRLVAAGGR